MAYKVWIVTEVVDYEGSTNLSAWCDLESAELEVERLTKYTKGDHYYDVEEFEVLGT